MKWVFSKLYEYLNVLINQKDETVNYKKVIDELKVIKRTIKPEYNIESEKNFDVYKVLNQVCFDSKNMNLDNETSLKTLEKKYQYLTLGYSSYQLTYDEYERVYLNKTHNKIEGIVSSIISLIKRYQDDPQIIYLLNTYSITIFTLSNTIKESMDLNGVISDEIKEDVITILSRFKTAVEGREQEIKQELQHDIDAVNQSLSDRLKSELHYVETYLK